MSGPAPLQLVMAQVRAVLAARRRLRTPRSGRGSAADRSRQLAALRSEVAAGLQALALDTPAGVAAGRRVFLESALLHGLGAPLALDPGFAELVGEVQRGFEDHPGLRQQLDGALRALATNACT